MRTRFKVLAALAGGMSALMVLAALLTLLPGRLPLPSDEVLMGVAFAVLFPLGAWTVAEGFLSGDERSMQWPAFRCLPGRVQWAVGALVVVAAVTAFADVATDSSRQSSGVREGRYYAFETSRGNRGTVEIGRQEYEELEESSRRGSLAVPGAMLAVLTALILVNGELRRVPVRAAPAAPGAVGRP
ncbi:hypothetical protein [Streptomyces sp. NPDC004284]|uniref:hypothetical protein n=1 Tax=Streptomyces sp. NPDC004284 TaxID=3364695 RepID=UPI0036B06CBA